MPSSGRVIAFASLLADRGNADYKCGVIQLASLLLNLDPQDVAVKLGVEGYTDEGDDHAV